MTDIEFWQKVFLASIRAGSGMDIAGLRATSAVEQAHAFIKKNRARTFVEAPGPKLGEVVR